jgi:hypothetical protein
VRSPWTACAVALGLSGCATGPNLTTTIAGYDWEPHPHVQPCRADAITWEQRTPYNGIGWAHVDWSECKVISIMSEQDAKRFMLSGPNFKALESLWDHERRHLLMALRHPHQR